MLVAPGLDGCQVGAVFVGGPVAGYVQAGALRAVGADDERLLVGGLLRAGQEIDQAGGELRRQARGNDGLVLLDRRELTGADLAQRLQQRVRLALVAQELLQLQLRLRVLAALECEGRTQKVDDLVAGELGIHDVLREGEDFAAGQGRGGVVAEGWDAAQVMRPAGLPADRGKADGFLRDGLRGWGNGLDGFCNLVCHADYCYTL